MTILLAEFGDELISAGLEDVYYDCLSRLGIDSYCIEAEIDNYKLTHPNQKPKPVVSSKH